MGFNYPFEDLGQSPIEAMLSPGERGHYWIDAAKKAKAAYLKEASTSDWEVKDDQGGWPLLGREGLLRLAASEGRISDASKRRLEEGAGVSGWDALGPAECASVMSFAAGLDKDDGLVRELEAALSRRVYDATQADDPAVAFERTELAPSTVPVELDREYYICSAPRAVFWEGSERLLRPVWAEDYSAHKSIVGVVAPYIGDYRYTVFVPTGYKAALHSVRESAVFGAVMAEGVCKDAGEAQARASYYMERCAALPLAKAGQYGFTEHKIAVRTDEFLCISSVDKSYQDYCQEQKRAAFKRLPEAEKSRRRAWARQMSARAQAGRTKGHRPGGAR